MKKYITEDYKVLQNIVGIDTDDGRLELNRVRINDYNKDTFELERYEKTRQIGTLKDTETGADFQSLSEVNSLYEILSGDMKRKSKGDGSSQRLGTVQKNDGVKVNIDLVHEKGSPYYLLSFIFPGLEKVYREFKLYRKESFELCRKLAAVANPAMAA